MKVSKKDIVLLIALAGILAAVCSYFFVYKPYSEKTVALETKNQELQTRVAELQNMKDNEALYIEEIQKMKTAMDDIYNLFPVDVRTEDMIMMGVSLANASPLNVNSMVMSEATDLYHVGQAQAEAAAAAAATAAAEAAAAGDTAEVAATDTPVDTAVTAPTEPEKILYKKTVGIVYLTTYEGFKNSITQITNSTDRRVIDSVTATYDVATGLMAGNTNVTMYCLTGTNKEYIAPSIPFIPQGTSNIFGTVDTMPTEGNTEETEE